ncbi:hypothetical protein D3C72_1226800 [compost metagenome]
MEGPDSPLSFPLGGQCGDHLAIFSHPQQPFKQVIEDIKFHVAFRQVRIQRSRLVTIGPHQLLFGGQLNACRHLGGLHRHASLQRQDD